MELMFEDAAGAFGMLVAEAVERLVDQHDMQLDKRAAMLVVDSPTFSQEQERLRFEFDVKGNRQKPVGVALDILPSEEESDADFSGTELRISLRCRAECRCDTFQRNRQCAHSLAASWWLQEQLGRRSIAEVLEFFGELEVDTVAAGSQLVNDLLKIAGEAGPSDADDQETRLQWRIRLGDSRYYSPISVTAYEQRPRKNGKGWTKGREIRTYNLMRRDFTGHAVDGRVAAMVGAHSYSFDGDHFSEFQSLQMLVGHPNVAWDDSQATSVSVQAAELKLVLIPEQGEGAEPDSTDAGDAEGIDLPMSALFYRPQLSVEGLDIDPARCEIVLGYTSPVEPLVVFADLDRDRLVLCPLRDARGTRLIHHLLKADLADLRIDAQTASRFAVGSGPVDDLIRVELPQQLAGPIEDVTAELVIELRPRTGAGLTFGLRMHDDRFRQLPAPGEAPDVISCLTDAGPVRLRRTLSDERARADAVTSQFKLNELLQDGTYHWIAETDSQALDLLASLYTGGKETPRMVWPEGESLRVRGELSPSSLRVQIDDRRDWFGLQGSISIDGQEVELSKLLEAVRERRSLVRIGDREFARISEAFRKRLEQLGDVLVSDRGGLRVADAAVPVVSDLIGDDVQLETAARWQQSIERLASLANWNPEQPEGLKAELREYQLEGYRWLARLNRWGVGGVLADDMGLGKTVQALGVLVDRAAEGPALVVAPTSVGDNWVRETNRFAPQLNPILYRDSDRQQLIESAAPQDVIIASYQLLQRDVAKFCSREWNTLVLDEAQFIKNANTKTSQAIRKLNANWRVGLSGTPLENHLGELWSLFRAISPGLLGSWERFRTRFAEPIERQRDDERRRSLARLVQPFILRRTKDKVLTELPPRTEINLQAELTPAERKLYEDARVAAIAELSGLDVEGRGAGDQRIRTLAWLTRLRQLACHPRLVDATWNKSSAKLDLLMSLIEELRDEDHRALVFSQFVKHLTVVRETLDRKGIHYQYLDGSTPAKERQRRVDAFQNGDGDLFLISLKAGGTGLNLTAADYVIHLDPWWNPAVEDQATDRAHRIGQDRPVTVYRLIAEGTIEENILEMHADKRELVAGVLDGADRAGRLETADLIELIREGTLA